MLRLTLSLFCIFACIQFSMAQDANYWSGDYGPAGFFTPGAVIANNNDSGVLFYNPALLGLSHKSATTLSGTVYHYESIKIKNGVGTGRDLNSKSTGIIPEMVSGIISLKGRKPFTIAYSLMHIPVMNFQASQQRDDKFNVLDDSYSPGPEYFVGQYNNQNIINQTSGSLSAGFKLSSHFAAGIAVEAQLRKQSFSSNYSMRALINNGNDIGLPPFVNAEESYLATYTHAGIKFRPGISYDIGKHHFGLTVSTPLLRIAGSATILSDNVLTNLILPPATDTLNILANARQTGLKPKWKMPVSIAFGYAYDYSKGQISVTAEYFAKVNEYNIITPRNDYFLRPDTANNTFTSNLLKLKDARKAICNFGVGFSYQLKEEVMGFLSLRTDFNFADRSLYKDDGGFTSNTSNWNNYHCQVGVNLKKRRFNLRAGLLLSYGTTNKYLQYVNFDDPHESNALGGTVGNTKASRSSAGLMMSYIHNL